MAKMPLTSTVLEIVSRGSKDVPLPYSCIFICLFFRCLPSRFDLV